MPNPKVLAIHLPQFHPTPENNEWWGEGFTEWKNVVNAKPQFKGHYQPHLPADLGFYDLRLADTRDAQAQMAKEYNIDGFCYYHYWMNGKRLLHEPIDGILASKSPDFPFCYFWANETWSRRWTGEEKEVLISQSYSEEDDRARLRLYPRGRTPYDAYLQRSRHRLARQLAAVAFVGTRFRGNARSAR